MQIAEGLDEKLLEMYQARDAILSRINPEIVSVIDIDRFLQAAVNEVGQRLAVDRCNVIIPSPDGGFRVSHEYRSDQNLPPGTGLNVPPSLVPTETIRNYLPKAAHYSIDDTQTAQLPAWVRTTCQLIGTRAVLVAPFVSRGELLGVIALHYCREPHRWSETEVRLVEWLAKQVAIGLHYTRLYREKEREVELAKLLLEISNEINARTDPVEVYSFIVDRAVEILEADYGFLAVLDVGGDHLHSGELRPRRGFDLKKAVEPRFREARRLPLSGHSVIRDLLNEGRTIPVQEASDSTTAEYLMSHFVRGRSALFAPVIAKEKALGLLALVWVGDAPRFSDYEAQLLEGMSAQLAITLEKDRLAAEVMRLKRELNDARAGERIIGSSLKMRRAMEMALSVADNQTTVLLQGESGSGKEMLANLIQFNSRRANNPFIKINCGAIPQALLETELFGHERGAFTDARSRRIGRFEEADGGTLFLDEIGEMSLAAQVSLLRVLQDGEFTRVGGNEVIRTDVRVIAATNKNLEQEIEAGHFRRDLFYRLNVYPLMLPPLRERVEDIDQLIAHFIEAFQEKSGRRVTGVSDRALRMLKSYPWPGNVRELENCIERSVIIAAGRQILEKDLPESIRAQGPTSEVSHVELSLPLRLDDIERAVIAQTLSMTGGDKAKAARLLGIGRKTLYRRLEQYKPDQP